MSENEKKTEEIIDEATDEVVEEATADVVEEEVVKSEVEVLQEKLDEMEDKFLRASAEIANITTRNRNEREQLQKYRSQDLAKKLLTSVDNLERAMAIEVHDEQAASLKKGVEMVLESLRNAFKEEGIEEIPAKGQTFDPTLHQAVQTIPASDEFPADTIVEVLQKGYKLHDRILRPTMVIVSQ
ncbi:MAG TPA: nucleotide exchange factor GrpE [Enterococcus columbae]|nr:nucleotide exchange factor GrpE [Enterococcus columbae]